MVRGGGEGCAGSMCVALGRLRGGIWAYGSGSVASGGGARRKTFGIVVELLLWDSPGDVATPPARPLVRPAPRSAMVFPLVVLVAVLPGLVALNAWDLTPPGPMWGLRGLAVLDGLVLDQMPAAEGIKPIQEAAAFRAVAYQPPLYAWMEAVGFLAERRPQSAR